ncbi:MAG: M23 family metallopeptidase [Bryobacteraceae bacterium]
MIVSIVAMLAAMPVGDPEVVKQGEVLRVHAQPGAETTATFRGRTVKLFPQDSGELLGLVPVPVLTPPGDYPMTIASGDAKTEHMVRVVDARYRVQNIHATASMKSLAPLPGEMETMKALQTMATDKRHWPDTFAAPTPQCESSPFGVKRLHNGKATGNFHRGVDLASPLGTEVRATAAGTVRVAKMFRLHGGTIGIDHGQGVTSYYIHLSQLLRQEGEFVQQGDVVAKVGATGFATGPHLHWGVYVNGETVNPAQWGVRAAPCPVPRVKPVRRK